MSSSLNIIVWIIVNSNFAQNNHDYETASLPRPLMLSLCWVYDLTARLPMPCEWWNINVDNIQCILNRIFHSSIFIDINMIYEYVLICCLDFSFLPLPPSFPLPWFCFDTVLFFDLWWTIKEMQPTSLQSVLLLWPLMVGVFWIVWNRWMFDYFWYKVHLYIVLTKNVAILYNVMFALPSLNIIVWIAAVNGKTLHLKLIFL